MQFGYARVSTSEQDTTLQLDALRRAGAGRVYQEKKAGAGVRRPELEQLLEQLRAGDVVMVYKVDRLARSMRDLIGIIDAIAARGAGFRSLTEAIDTSSPAGKMLMHMIGAIAEFERSLIAERSIAGQRAAMDRGVHCGRPAALTAKEGARARDLYSSGRWTLTELANRHGVHISSIKRAIARASA